MSKNRICNCKPTMHYYPCPLSDHRPERPTMKAEKQMSTDAFIASAHLRGLTHSCLTSPLVLELRDAAKEYQDTAEQQLDYEFYTGIAKKAGRLHKALAAFKEKP